MSYVPTRFAHRLLFVLKSAWRGRKWRRKHTSARLNLQRVFGPFLPARTIEILTAQYHRERIRAAIDLDFLRHLPEAKLVRWLKSGVEFSGLDQLASARSKGQGIILCGFHFCSAELLIPLLWLRGYSFVGAGSHGLVRNKVVPSKLVLDDQVIEGGIPGCGKVTWFSKFSFQGVLEILRALMRGEMALVFADGYVNNRPDKETAKYFGNLAGQYRPARTPVKFLGQMTAANTAIPWICLQSGALLFPVKLFRRGEARFRVVIEPPLDLSLEQDVGVAAEALYGVLQRDIYLHPSQWQYWNSLHEFATSPDELEERVGRKISAT